MSQDFFATGAAGGPTDSDGSSSTNLPEVSGSTTRSGRMATMPRKGPFIAIVGYVWDCGDDVCNCTQATIEALWKNADAPGWLVREYVWQGEFHTDGESGASEELMEVRSAMALFWPEAEAKVAWGWMTPPSPWPPSSDETGQVK